MLENSKYTFYALLTVFILSFVSAVFHFGAHHSPSRESGERPPVLFQKDGIGLLTISGPISAENSPSGFRPQEFFSLLDKIHSFEKNTSVKAVVVRINSPGGTVGASQELFSALLRLKHNRRIPIIVSVGDVAASGGYWIAMAGDTIFANPGSLVGSIGVIMQNYNLEEVTKKLGVDVHTYKSGPYKDLLSSFRPTTDHEKQLVQTMINTIQSQFIETVMSGRNMDNKTVQSIADGRIFTGSQAKDLGLIDQLGGLDVAISYTGQLVGLGTSPTILGQDPPGVQQLLNLLQQQALSFFGGILHGVWQHTPLSIQAR